MGNIEQCCGGRGIVQQNEGSNSLQIQKQLTQQQGGQAIFKSIKQTVNLQVSQQSSLARNPFLRNALSEQQIKILQQIEEHPKQKITIPHDCKPDLIQKIKEGNYKQNEVVQLIQLLESDSLGQLIQQMNSDIKITEEINLGHIWLQKPDTIGTLATVFVAEIVKTFDEMLNAHKLAQEEGKDNNISLSKFGIPVIDNNISLSKFGIPLIDNNISLSKFGIPVIVSPQQIQDIQIILNKVNQEELFEKMSLNFLSTQDRIIATLYLGLCIISEFNQVIKVFFSKSVLGCITQLLFHSNDNIKKAAWGFLRRSFGINPHLWGIFEKYGVIEGLEPFLSIITVAEENLEHLVTLPFSIVGKLQSILNLHFWGDKTDDTVYHPKQ